jgi:hypothetical protein
MSLFDSLEIVVVFRNHTNLVCCLKRLDNSVGVVCSASLKRNRPRFGLAEYVQVVLSIRQHELAIIKNSPNIALVKGPKLIE